jgi:hypothetical protein
MASPLSTENPTPGPLIPSFTPSSLRDIPASRTAQKQNRLLAFTFHCRRPFEKTSSFSIPYISATLWAIRSISYLAASIRIVAHTVRLPRKEQILQNRSPPKSFRRSFDEPGSAAPVSLPLPNHRNSLAPIFPLLLRHQLELLYRAA